MVMLDRRKLAAPLFAQAAAFVVVLVIGGFTGHAKTPSGTTPGATPSASTRTSPSASKGPALKLTVKVVEEGTGGRSVSGSPVNVLPDGTLTSVVSGTLNSALEFAANVAAGQYQVCISPPRLGQRGPGHARAGGLDLFGGRRQDRSPAGDVPAFPPDPPGWPMSSHGRRRPGPEGQPGSAGPGRLGAAGDRRGADRRPGRGRPGAYLAHHRGDRLRRRGRHRGPGRVPVARPAA